jgi:hypothetical protein
MNPLKIRLINDVTGEDREFPVDRDPAEVFRDAMTTVRATRKTMYRLCVHMGGRFPNNTLVLHWFTNDDQMLRDVTFVAETAERMTEGILTGRVKV